MKIALAQLNYHIGNFEANSAKIKAAITDARKEGADLVVFSELSVCGYPPQDLLEFDDFISRSLETVEEIAAECRDIAAIVGAPSRNEKKGKKLFNSAFLLAEGKIDSVVHKGLLPTYDVFEEYRHFEPETSSKILTYKGFRIALTICEDLWNLGDHPLYTFCPMDALIKANPHVMLNIAASPFSYEQQMERRDVMLKNVEKYGLPLLYINHVGAQTDLIFDGGSLVIDSEGELLDELQYFEEDLRVYELTDRNGRTEITKQKEREATYFVKSKTEWIYEALVLGIRDYFAKMGFRKAVLGLSGGIDSAVVLALAERALGNENVYAILLPSQFSSDHSVKDSQEMCRTLHVPYDIIPIKDIYNAAEKGLHPLFRGLPFGITEENLQARIRGLLLMAISNKQGYILLNTTNKSEMAVGYGTLYGDMCGGISVIGDVYKTDVYSLARHINRNLEIIPENIIKKAPSAELRPGQKDSDSLPDYDTLDKILYQYIEERKSLKSILKMGFEEALVSRVLKLVNMNEYKRYQAAPVLRVSPKAFGTGRKMPIVARYDF